MNINERLKENFNEIMDAASDDLLITDGHGVVLRVSQSFEECYGLSNEDAIGKTIYELEADGYFKPSVIAETLKCGNKVTMNQKSSSGRDILVTATPVFDDDGNIKFVVSFSRDITEMRSLQKKYSKLQNKVERYEGEINKLRRVGSMSDIISHSPAMEKVISLAKQVADYDTNILLTGDSGVGKSFMAKRIHKMSNRAEHAFVDINCAAIPENLLEAELFGYEAGAFTGADSRGKVGLIEMAHHGTLLLDEVSELPISLQAKLLKAIQDKKITKIGGVNEIDVDFRLITATNKNLEECVENRTFRKDLYYRLNVMKIHIPPLAERKEDIVPLVDHFINELNEKYCKDKSISKDALNSLCRYDWPGNIREVSNIVERIYVTSANTVLQISDLPEELITDVPIFSEELGLDAAVEELERKIVTEAYEKLRTTSAVARYLRISQPTASRKIAKYIK